MGDGAVHAIAKTSSKHRSRHKMLPLFLFSRFLFSWWSGFQNCLHPRSKRVLFRVLFLLPKFLKTRNKITKIFLGLLPRKAHTIDSLCKEFSMFEFSVSYGIGPKMIQTVGGPIAEEAASPAYIAFCDNTYETLVGKKGFGKNGPSQRHLNFSFPSLLSANFGRGQLTKWIKKNKIHSVEVSAVMKMEE